MFFKKLIYPILSKSQPEFNLTVNHQNHYFNNKFGITNFFKFIFYPKGKVKDQKLFRLFQNLICK